MSPSVNNPADITGLTLALQTGSLDLIYRNIGSFAVPYWKVPAAREGF